MLEEFLKEFIEDVLEESQEDYHEEYLEKLQTWWSISCWIPGVVFGEIPGKNLGGIPGEIFHLVESLEKFWVESLWDFGEWISAGFSVGIPEGISSETRFWIPEAPGRLITVGFSEKKSHGGIATTITLRISGRFLMRNSRWK